MKNGKGKRNSKPNRGKKKTSPVDRAVRDARLALGVQMPASIDQCVLDYAYWQADAKAAYDRGILPCIPDTKNSVNSQKIIVRQTFQVNVQAAATNAGIAYGVFCPDVTNNNTAAFYSTSSATQTDKVEADPAQSLGHAITKLPYDDNNNLVQGRCVAATMLVKASGNMFNAQSSIYLLNMPENRSMDQFVASDFDSYPMCDVRTYQECLREGTCVVRWTPPNVELTKYRGLAQSGLPLMGFYGEGLDSSNNFVVTLYAAYEFTGPPTSNSSTPSPSNDLGFAKVNDAMKRLPATAKAHKARKSLKHSFGDAALSAAKLAGKVGGEALASGAKAFLTSLL